MQLTDEQLEQAARELLAIKGYPFSAMPGDQYFLHAKNVISGWLQIQEAVNRVKDEAAKASKKRYLEFRHHHLVDLFTGKPKKK